MSHLATNWAVLQRGISPVAKLILWHLADCHHPKHGCFPHIETLVANCEVSRATVLRVLHELEGRHLILRIKRQHGITKKQLTNRYILGFEDGFASHEPGGVQQVYVDDDEDQGRVSDCDPASVIEESDDQSPHASQMTAGGKRRDLAGLNGISGPHRDQEADTALQAKNRVSDCDPARQSRVSNQGQAGCQIEGEPGVTGETPNRSVTSNRTSKGTGKRAQGRDRESVFAEIWKVFPRHPTSSEVTARELFATLDDAEAKAALKGAERFAAWWKLQEPGKAAEERLRYTKHLARWLHERGWIEAMKLPVPATLTAEAAEAMAGMITVNKWKQGPLFAACERVRGRPVPVGKSGSWSFEASVVEAAQSALTSGTGPP